MKRELLKGVAVALALTAVTMTTIYAQPTRPARAEMEQPEDEQPEKLTPEQKATKMTESMTKRLGLTETQTKKLYKVNLDYINKLIESKQLKGKHNLEVLDILDADQSLQFMDMLLKQPQRKAKQQQKKGGEKMQQGGRRERMQEGRPEGNPEGRPERRPRRDVEVEVEE